MAPKRGTKRSFEATELEDSANLPKQTKLSRAGRVVRASTLPTPAATSSPEGEQDDTAPKTKKKPAARKAASRKPAPKKAPTAGKAYKDGIKEVDKKFYQLVKKYKPNPTEWSGITADDFAASMYRFLPKVKMLREESIPAAFNLLLDIGEHAYGDLDACCNAGGFGETGKPYKAMDTLLVDLITARKEAQAGEGDGNDDDGDGGGDGGANADKSSPGDAGFVLEPSTGDLDGAVKRILDRLAAEKKKRPNKQERGWLERAHRDDLKAMFEARRERREEAHDWAGNALNDLVETNKRIGAYGVEGYFRESIALLASMKGVAA
ncbi:hypothetical protein SLS62_003232 [Diatrype stigma]|uniref:Uncharacterized protein n=1 Tax=Diatrype stigma TaxID=117547 RepID=A0AAN9UYM2_9PEZI